MIKLMKLPVRFETSPCNQHTIEPTWLVTCYLGNLKLLDNRYHGKSEKQAIKVAKDLVKELFED